MNIDDRLLRYNRQLTQLLGTLRKLEQHSRVNVAVSYTKGVFAGLIENLHETQTGKDPDRTHGAIDELGSLMNSILDLLIFDHHEHHEHEKTIDRTEDENAADDAKVAEDDPEWPSSIDSDGLEIVGKHEDGCDCVHCSKDKK